MKEKSRVMVMMDLLTYVFLSYHNPEITRSHLDSLASHYLYSLGSACGAFVYLFATILDIEINILCFISNIQHMSK